MAHATNLDIKVAFLEEKRLVLMVMDVATGSLPGLDNVFENRVGATCGCARKQNFERDDARKIECFGFKVSGMNGIRVCSPSGGSD